MAAAYAYADGGQQPEELRNLWLVERFGVQAIFNRPYLGSKELKSMLLAERVYNAYKEMKNSTDWATWAIDNPDDARLLDFARKFAKEQGLIDG